jgi:hypothetical protein
VKPGDPVLASNQNEVIDRANADVCGPGAVNSIGWQRRKHVLNSRDDFDMVRVFNSSYEDCPPRGVIYVSAATLWEPVESGAYPGATFYGIKNYSGTWAPAHMTGSFLAVNGEKTFPARTVKWLHVPDEYRPALALYDNSQFYQPAASWSLGPLPGTWKLGPGIPGFKAANGLLAMPTGSDTAESTLPVVMDHNNKAWWMYTNQDHNGKEPYLSGYAVIPGGSVLYNGIQNTPLIELRLESVWNYGANGYAIRATNAPDLMYVPYAYGKFKRVSTLHAIHDYFDDPKDTIKFWTGSTANPPHGWTYIGDYGAVPMIKRNA